VRCLLALRVMEVRTKDDFGAVFRTLKNSISFSAWMKALRENVFVVGVQD